MTRAPKNKVHFGHYATLTQLKTEIDNAIAEQTIGGYLPPYNLSETGPEKPQGSQRQTSSPDRSEHRIVWVQSALLIDDEQKVIAGHGRLLAARKMGWDTAPAIKLSHLNEPQRIAFLIADTA